MPSIYEPSFSFLTCAQSTVTDFSDVQYWPKKDSATHLCACLMNEVTFIEKCRDPCSSVLLSWRTQPVCVPSQVRHPSSVNQLKRQIYSAKEKKSIDSMSLWEDRQSSSKLLRILKFQQGVNMHLLSKGTKGVAPPTTDRPLFGLQSQTGLLNCQVCVKSLSSSHSGWRHLGRQTI